ncbi:ROK family protein [Anaerocolumna sp. AGMB13025]|uniref:ROK family protein n=1 Tax=Anaerocolumna sp. AGMB13025 TaxID=3039116 RepID=UPI00241CC84E|nr:ROK family protein [Anaerocolumna sp. AGMB13025]WFR57454.1 ROK family protein [Anaerocolumna sp. AGMB13025]
MDTFIGCDFGGTKLLIGEIDETGRILNSKRYDTGIKKHTEAAAYILSCLTDYIGEAGFVGKPKAAGAGVVGVVDYAKGIWRSMDHVETTPIPLAALISDKLGIPAAVDNDVKCATRAEMMFGQGKYSDNFIYLNIGTGIAAGFVVEGNILRGANNNSGEVGHCVVDLSREEICICGRHGCVEGIASGSGFSKQAVCLLDQYPTRLEGVGKGKVNVSEIFKGADQGDALCMKLTEQAMDNLSNLIMNLVRTTDPDTIVLGGGVVSDGWLLPKICEKLNPSTMRGVKNGVIKSNFNPGLVGLIGAGAQGIVKLQELKHRLI